jgi:hypothetical protein
LVLNCRQKLFCFVTRELAASLVGRRLEEIVLYMVKRLTFLDEFAFLEQDVFQVASDPRVNFDFIDRLDPPDKVFGFGDRLVLGLDCADRNHDRRLLLRR